MSGPPSALIAGAGLAGSLTAIILAELGWQVTVLEQRPDPRIVAPGEGRSVNLGLSARGLAGLAAAGLAEEVLAVTVPMRGRIIHDRDGALHHQPYGTRADEILHSLDRVELAATLIAAAERTGRVSFRFDTTVTGVDPERGMLSVQARGTDQQHEIRADLVIGADGAYSRVRRDLEKAGRCRTRLDILPWGYKELTIPPAPDGTARTPLEALHVWPGQEALIVAHPNRDASLTATLFLPLEGPEPSAASLREDTAFRQWFDAAFPDAPALMPRRVEEFRERPTGRLVTVRTDPWVHGGTVALIGDAAHAVYPFYGQGMNSAFEDVLVLRECLLTAGATDASPAALGAALAAYAVRRKPHLDVLATLSERNFEELRRKTASPWFRLRKQADLVLHRAFPRAWVPLYTMVSHRRIPYGDAVRRAHRQDRILAWGLGASGLAGIAIGTSAYRRTRTGGGR